MSELEPMLLSRDNRLVTFLRRWEPYLACKLKCMKHSKMIEYAQRRARAAALVIMHHVERALPEAGDGSLEPFARRLIDSYGAELYVMDRMPPNTSKAVLPSLPQRLRELGFALPDPPNRYYTSHALKVIVFPHAVAFEIVLKEGERVPEREVQIIAELLSKIEGGLRAAIGTKKGQGALFVSFIFRMDPLIPFMRTLKDRSVTKLYYGTGPIGESLSTL